MAGEWKRSEREFVPGAEGRIHAGLEDADDLKQDIEKGLERMKKAKG